MFRPSNTGPAACAKGPPPSSGKIDKSVLARTQTTPRSIPSPLRRSSRAVGAPSDSHYLRFAQSVLWALKSATVHVPLCRGHHRQLHQRAMKSPGGKRSISMCTYGCAPVGSRRTPRVTTTPWRTESRELMVINNSHRQPNRSCNRVPAGRIATFAAARGCGSDSYPARTKRSSALPRNQHDIKELWSFARPSPLSTGE